MTIKPPSNEPAIRLGMMPKDTNPEGNIFGGVILSLIDQAAYIEAMRQAPGRYVTVAMNAIEFQQPVHVGDVVSLWTKALRVGRSSITIHVDVRARFRDSEVHREVTTAEVTMVATDENAKPQPRFV